MQRRQALQVMGTAMLGWPLVARIASAAEPTKRRLLFFSRSVLFEHPVIRRAGDELSLAEKAVVALARQINCEVECTKDGRVFDDDLDEFAAIVSYTCGSPTDLMKPDSLDGSPPLSERGWKKLDAAVRGGKALVAIHPGIWLLPAAAGADCIGHGTQQAARIQVVSPQFPGVEQLGDSFSLMEEWFSLIRFAQDLHVILVQDCAGMDTTAPEDRRCYDRPPFPITWARMHDQGRVFYTSLGHRDDVWSSQIFQQILRGGLSWALGRVEADITPNIDQVAPHANSYLQG
ncbi:MAG: ThuA domain-containing protein [Pirellulaceae bacterium]|nr:ThuA domain-containing protein [Pirellulaceae bacterium]